jgi:hypothetical protein
MDDSQKSIGSGDTSQLSLEELRSAPRFTLLIRSAKLIGETGEYLCVIRDVSASGVRLRIFHPLPPGDTFQLELSAGDRFDVERVWEGKDHAGFRFADWIDVHGFIAEASPYPKRALRLRVDFPAMITTDGAGASAAVRDLSREGARIETELPLAIRQKVKLTAQGLPPIMATVCWRSTGAYGLVFQQCFTFEELARLAVKLQPFDGRPSHHSPEGDTGESKRYA